jgi:adenine deaminase
MFCSDDKHPDSLLVGHINKLCARAIALGYDLFDVLQAACINPVKHYKLPVGLLQPNAAADFILVDDLVNFNVKQTYINGKLVYDEGEVLINSVEVNAVNKFNITPLQVDNFAYTPKETEHIIVCEDGQLVTRKLTCNKANINPQNDVLKIAVVNRYAKAKVATAYIKNFGLKQGAIASSVAHDSHNIVVVGIDDESICKAVNLLVENTGGLSAVSATESYVLPLPVAGLMSNRDAWEVADLYTQIDSFSKQVLGSTLRAPFMSLSFMALLVIPSIKLSDKGLFDGDTFTFLREV